MELHPAQIVAAHDAKAVTPDGTADLPDGAASALYVGGEGDVAMVTAGGPTVTIAGAAGVVPIRTRQLGATGTTATSILALYPAP